ncbi:MAG: thermonuclease family protein [Nitrospirae bacterium]|nr:thermonuclease family protein [Nitrospirota bacterium]
MDRIYSRQITVFMILTVILFYSLCDNSRAGTKNVDTVYVRVAKVHDGDTISVVFNGRSEKVRLIGIDAPELYQETWGLRAKKHLEKILTISNRMVSLEFDPERRDKYERLLCYVFTADKKMINLQMLKDGYAMLYTIPPNLKYVNELRKAQGEARRLRLGIWGSSGLKERPCDYRKKHPRL